MIWSLQKRSSIRTAKYTDDFVLLAKEEAMLQGMAEKLIEIGKSYGKN
jgi:hypothetical protein